MKLHLRFDAVRGDHAHMSLFVNGALAGSVVMRNAEAVWFHHILWKGAEYLRLKPGEFAFVASGEAPPATDAEIAALARERPTPT